MLVINTNKLKGKIIEQGMTVASLADKIGIDKSTLYRKLSSGGESMLVGEANAIVKALHLSAEDAVAIFFSQAVA